MKFVLAAIVTVTTAGCVTDRVRFNAGPGQTALVRDGKPAVSSVGKDSVVLLSRTGRDIPAGQRVGFVLAMQNRGKGPLNFTVSEVRVEQSFGAGGTSQPLEVLTFEKLQQEEKTRQVVSAILVGVAAGANAAAASQSGYYRANTTFYTPRGTYVATTTGYSPTAAAIASSNASAQNAAMIESSIAQGQANMARLEQDYIKDHTLLPGEWYGGTVGIAPPTGEAKQKTYQIRVHVGSDVHVFDAVQEPTSG
ncbi:hypothetical protein [Bosea sp. Tri-44]|uniref:hypothetical protein n=1 Tax=Bosea sp. Tri-44 TaxID=1972137 RepID=UPI00100EFF6E|nr:hypothetical protein [Bosea sp. Tri-44]